MKNRELVIQRVEVYIVLSYYQIRVELGVHLNPSTKRNIICMIIFLYFYIYIYLNFELPKQHAKC